MSGITTRAPGSTEGVEEEGWRKRGGGRGVDEEGWRKRGGESGSNI
jgi:hypothetical protein